MKTYVFIVLRRYHRNLLARRGDFHCFHAVEVLESESLVQAVERGVKEVVSVLYQQKIRVSAAATDEFEFNGERIVARFATVDGLGMIVRPESGIVPDLDLTRSEPDVFVRFFADVTAGRVPVAA
jgi:hypothetical protein